jgi:hypothetical protein
MKKFLTLCIALMFVAGIYGATDMTRDLKTGRLIEYEHVRERHAKALLFIIKTTGLGTYKFQGSHSGGDVKPATAKKIQKEEVKEKKMMEYFEEFSRGDCNEC